MNLIAALAAANTTLAAGSAGITALFLNLLYLERTTGEPVFDLQFAMNGSLSGLVAITAGCGIMEPWAALVTGVVAGLVYNVGSKALIFFRLDDAVDAIPVHMFNGGWGMISVGLFASPSHLLAAYGRNTHAGWVYDGADPTLLGVELVGFLFICGWVMVIMLPFFVWLDWKGWFRSDPLEEIVGLDTSYHGGLTLAGPEEVNPEYISAYQQQRSNLRRRHQAGRGSLSAASDQDEPVMETSDPASHYRPAEPMVLIPPKSPTIPEGTEAQLDWRNEIESVPTMDQNSMLKASGGAAQQAYSVSTMGDDSAGFLDYLAQAEERENEYVENHEEEYRGEEDYEDEYRRDEVSGVSHHA